MADEITVCIAAHPVRAINGMLDRAIASALKQTRMPHRVIVQMDNEREGGHVTHHKMLAGVNTPWVAFLDSDDEFLPEHLERCLFWAKENDADYVYPWFETVPPNGDPFPDRFGTPWDNDNPVCTTITVFVRTELAQAVGFKSWDAEQAIREKGMMGEDWQFTLGCMERNAKIVHLPERTWLWHHHGMNTSSNPQRGDAAWNIHHS